METQFLRMTAQRLSDAAGVLKKIAEVSNAKKIQTTAAAEAIRCSEFAMLLTRIMDGKANSSEVPVESQDDLLEVTEVAQFLGVNVETVRRMVRTDRVDTGRTAEGRSGHIRIRRRDMEAMRLQLLGQSKEKALRSGSRIQDLIFETFVNTQCNFLNTRAEAEGDDGKTLIEYHDNIELAGVVEEYYGPVTFTGKWEAIDYWSDENKNRVSQLDCTRSLDGDVLFGRIKIPLPKENGVDASIVAPIVWRCYYNDNTMSTYWQYHLFTSRFRVTYQEDVPNKSHLLDKEYFIKGFGSDEWLDTNLFHLKIVRVS